MRKASAVRMGIIRPTDFLKRQPFGGASGFLENILPAIDSPVVIYGIGINGTPSWQPMPLRANVEFIAIADFSYPSTIPMRLKAFWGYLRYRRRILRSGIDILYVHSPESALPFLFHNRHVPVIFHQHGSGNPMLRSKYAYGRNRILARLFDVILREIHKRADWIIAIDQLCLEQVKRNGSNDKVSLLLNAVDIKKFSPNQESREHMRKRLAVDDEQHVILFVGRIEQVKRVDRLLDCMAYLKSSEVPFRLYLLGEGSLKKRFEDYVTEKRIQDLVTFVGYVASNELPSYYNMADVLVLPSEMEGVPMVLLEALACGTPVIASRVGGIPDLVSNRANGILLDEASPKALSTAIKEVCSYNFSRRVIANSVMPCSSVQ